MHDRYPGRAGLRSHLVGGDCQARRLSKGVISYHFAGKRELIQQVIEQVDTDEAWFLKLVRDREGTAAEKLRFYIQSHFDFVKDERKLLHALMEIFHNVRNSDGTELYEGSSYERRVELLEAILRQGQEQGEFRYFDPRVMAISLRAALDALPQQLNLHPDLDIDIYAAEVIALFDRATRRESPAETPQEV